MNKVNIEILDEVWSQATDKQSIELLRPLLSVASTFWYKSKREHRMKKKASRKFFINAKTGLFYTGFMPRVRENFEVFEVSKSSTIENKFTVICPATLPNITLREDQLDLIKVAVEVERGILTAPPAIGKTILALGIISCYPGVKVLFLCHSISLVRQTVEELKKFRFRDITVLSGDQKELTGNIVVSNYQAFSRLDPKDYCDYFNLVIVDECHLAMAKGSSYEKILSNLSAPLRFGLTATLPEQEEKKMTLEGLLGPVIGKITIQEGQKLDLIAKLRLKIVRVPQSDLVKETRKYSDVYQVGIVANRARNRLIIKEAKHFMDQGATVLIFITFLEHGHNLVEMARSLFDLDIQFIRGETEAEAREEIKKALLSKETRAVISSVIWREGINIPSLGVVINAAGGKSEVATLQAIGRGLRKSEGKDEVWIVDFLDLSHHYLIKHFGERLALYSDMGWL